jgi:signal transduction histidine kinase
VLVSSAVFVSWLGDARRRAAQALAHELERSEATVHARTQDLEHAVSSLRAEVRLRAEAESRALQGQERLRALAERLVMAEHAERRRVAGELHDGVGQLLSAASIRAGAALSAGGKGVAEALDTTRDLVKRALEQIRTLSSELSPPALERVPAGRSLEWLARRLGQLHGVGIDVVAEELGAPLAVETRVFLFQAARELVLNAVKHGRATEVRIRLSRRSAAVALEVADDGGGFDPACIDAEPRMDGGFGLFSLRERAWHLGGTLRIDAAHCRGAVIVVTVPHRTGAGASLPYGGAETDDAV